MSQKTILTNNLGYPRIGERRQLKKAIEAYWKGSLPLDELLALGKDLRARNWKKQRDAGIDLIPSNDFSFYDQVLDTSCMVGNVPMRFGWNGGNIDLDTTFFVARGKNGAAEKGGCECPQHGATSASEMTKWFDTNYHYLTPEFHAGTAFRLASNKAVEEFLEAKAIGIVTKPVLIGPVTYLSLGKVREGGDSDFDRFELFEKLLPVYEDAVRQLAGAGAEWIQIDEPILVSDLSERQKELLKRSFSALSRAAAGSKLLLATYFGELRDNLDLACELECGGLHVDAVRGESEVEAIAEALPEGRLLSLGIVDGRNIWKNDYSKSSALIERAREARGPGVLAVAPSCSLLHSPVSLKAETKLDAELKSWLAFADEKLREVAELAALASGAGESYLAKNLEAAESRRNSQRIHNASVKSRVAGVAEGHTRRKSPFAQRQVAQRSKLNLPFLPTTTIGSFPQTREVRAARSRWKKGDLGTASYEAFLREKTRECVAFQDAAGIDVLVHGEFERNDMVEYFGEQLDGFAFTQQGWVQSYGTRCVKPPLIYGDVSRPHAMTVDWASFAQSLTARPMKGMLTGPVTILQWSFVRDDQPRSETAKQIALAIRDEVLDLEAAGIGVIQVDEPAIREGLPLRRSDWDAYLKWAIGAFRVSVSGVRDETQIHTHMCYSDFNDIIEAIAAMDADVITIETSRSNMELLDAFVNFLYPAEIGPGVYDIHSPAIPSLEEMDRLIRKAAAVLPVGNLWVNPDCGLKTRGWDEVKPSLERMVKCAASLRVAIGDQSKGEHRGVVDAG